MSQHQFTTTRNERVEAAVAAVRKGREINKRLIAQFFKTIWQL